MLTKKDIDWLKEEFTADVASAVEQKIANKLDAIDTKLDAFVGEIQSAREAQELHQGQHDEVQEQLDHHGERIIKIEKKLQLPA